MQREISRLQDYINKYPDIEIWIISKTKVIAKCYWDYIKEYIKTNKKPYFISPHLLDGLNPINAIILLCGQWYMNPIIDDDIFKMQLHNARLTLPIGEIPEPKWYDELNVILTNEEMEDILSLANVAFDEGFGDEREERTIKKIESIYNMRIDITR